MNENLPLYTTPEYKQKLIEMGCSGTVYSLVMPESEYMLEQVVDGYNRYDRFMMAASPEFDEAGRLRDQNWLDMYREPWTQKQDSKHDEYFEQWFEWTKPVLNLPVDHFQHRYPTAGASEGIFKIMAEHYSQPDITPIVHMFDGDYEGFSAFAESLNLIVHRHDRNNWRESIKEIDGNSLFFISQPSAIDGEIWEGWDDFMVAMTITHNPVIPDLTYVGSVAKDYNIRLGYYCIPAIVFSHSKPLGGYYHRVGGVISRNNYKSLFGNKWFKNLQSLKWATMMMREYDVQYLPRLYRHVQEEATEYVSKRLGIDLTPASVMLLATAKPVDNMPELLKSLVRKDNIRLCITPEMDNLIR